MSASHCYWLLAQWPKVPLSDSGSTKFKVCKTVHHRTIQINHQPDATIFQFIILTFIYSSTCFGHFPAHHQELNDCSGSLWSGWPRTQHDYHHDTKVKSKATTAVIELLMMGGKTPETCWAVNRRQNNKLENCCIRLVIYLNCSTKCLSRYISHYCTILIPSASFCDWARRVSL